MRPSFLLYLFMTGLFRKVPVSGIQVYYAIYDHCMPQMSFIVPDQVKPPGVM